MTANEGLALGYKRAEDAANNAGETWRALAYAALLKFAEAYTTFSIEDVRRGNPQLPAPPDNRAWGSIARRAVREGAIEFLRYDKAKLPNVHGSTVRVWRSKLG
jgi:hypothetical protein